MASEWQSLKLKLEYTYPLNRPKNKTPAVPRTIAQYKSHQAALQSDQAEYLQKKMEYMEQQKTLENPDKKLVPAFEGRIFGSLEYTPNVSSATQPSPNPLNRSAVLSQESIWCGPLPKLGDAPPATPWRNPAPWPSAKEMSWEGDERVATDNGRYGRYTALPRVHPPNYPEVDDGVEWKNRPLQVAYPFDQVRPVPTEEDIYGPVEPITDKTIIASLLNTDLLAALDEKASTAPNTSMSYTQSSDASAAAQSARTPIFAGPSGTTGLSTAADSATSTRHSSFAGPSSSAAATNSSRLSSFAGPSNPSRLSYSACPFTPARADD